MHPMNYLFEDIYGNWGVASDAAARKRRGRTGPWKRDLHFLVERKRS